MGFNQTSIKIGNTLSGIPIGTDHGQTVFNIGRNYIFYSTGQANQLIGHLISCDPLTGEPLKLIEVNKNIAPSGLPATPSWNSGNVCHVTYDESIKKIVLFYKHSNSGQIYRGVWNNASRIFDNFSVFCTFSGNVNISNYGGMTRIDDNTIKIITDFEYVFTFNLKTGAITQQPLSVGGTWSPSSYPFSNTFYTLDGFIVGFSGSGNNAYVQNGNSAAYSDNPCDSSGIITNVQLITSSSHHISPSQHFDISYYTPNNGSISAYKNSGTYIEPSNFIPMVTLDEEQNKIINIEDSRLGFYVYDEESDACVFEVSNEEGLVAYATTILNSMFVDAVYHIETDLNDSYIKNMVTNVEHTLTSIINDNESYTYNTLLLYILSDNFNKYIVYNKSCTTKTIPLPVTTKQIYPVVDYTGGELSIAISTDGGLTYKLSKDDCLIDVPEGSNIVFKFLMSANTELLGYSFYWI